MTAQYQELIHATTIAFVTPNLRTRKAATTDRHYAIQHTPTPHNHAISTPASHKDVTTQQNYTQGRGGDLPQPCYETASRAQGATISPIPAPRPYPDLGSLTRALRQPGGITRETVNLSSQALIC